MAYIASSSQYSHRITSECSLFPTLSPRVTKEPHAEKSKKKHLLRQLVKKVLIHDRRTIELWYGLPNPSSVRTPGYLAPEDRRIGGHRLPSIEQRLDARQDPFETPQRTVPGRLRRHGMCIPPETGMLRSGVTTATFPFNWSMTPPFLSFPLFQ